jgi:hypothetical protein
MKTGVMRVEFSGPLSLEAFVWLRNCLVQRLEIAAGYVMHYERALMALGDLPPAPPTMYNSSAPPTAVICRFDQLGYWRAFSMRVARMGVVRPCFLDLRADAAYQWVESMAVARERPQLRVLQQ